MHPSGDQGAKKILEMTRLCSLVFLLLHFYFYCYTVFDKRGLSSTITDMLLQNIMRTGLFKTNLYSKLWALGLLVLSLVGSRGRPDEKLHVPATILTLFTGFVFYFLSSLSFLLPIDANDVAWIYMAFTTAAYLLILGSGSRLSRIIHHQLSRDIFNDLNETFPQEERRIENGYSVNLAANYSLKGKIRPSWINIINPFRGILVIGSPGAGKSWFVIRHIIRQHIKKGFALFVYDFKFADLTLQTYSWHLAYKRYYPTPPSFYVINFDQLHQSHRCNPLAPGTMHDITDAAESARAILLGLNKEWINKQGDFFVESPINFLSAVIWFLRQYEQGRYCTLPHVIELMQTDYDQLFPVLNTEPQIEVLINPFISAYQNNAMEQLEGQVASAKIGMARLSSPQLYWVLAGDDFTLDINNPSAPKIVCMGNNPEKQQVYSAVLSLYISRMVRMVNKKNQLKCSLVFDEFPTLFFNHIDTLIATARSNLVATTLGMQDFSQLKKDYGRNLAEVIMNITGNIISGQVMGETARQLSERFGRIMQQRDSLSVNSTDTSVSHSSQMDLAIPASKIAALSSGEFVGMVADNPQEKIKLKMFHSEILISKQNEEHHHDMVSDLPTVTNVSQQQINDHYYQVKMDIKKLVSKEIARLKEACNKT